MHLVQIIRENERRVGAVEGGDIRLLNSHSDTRTRSFQAGKIRADLMTEAQVGTGRVTQLFTFYSSSRSYCGCSRR